MTGHEQPQPHRGPNDRRCSNTIREFDPYRYPETAAPASERGRAARENTLTKDDDTTLGVVRPVRVRLLRPATAGDGDLDLAVRQRGSGRRRHTLGWHLCELGRSSTPRAGLDLRLIVARSLVSVPTGRIAAI